MPDVEVFKETPDTGWPKQRKAAQVEVLLMTLSWSVNDGALDIVSCVPCQLFITRTDGCVCGHYICGPVLGRLNIDGHRHAKMKKYIQKGGQGMPTILLTVYLPMLSSWQGLSMSLIFWDL